jgi:hypothetical protein
LAEGLARVAVEVAVAEAVAQAALEEGSAEGLARVAVEVAVAEAVAQAAALEEGSAEGLARAAVEVAVAEAVAQAALEVGSAGRLARAAGQEREAAVQATVDQVPVGRAEAEDPVQAAVSAAGEGNPANGWRLRPCCAAPRWAGWGEQEASAPA